MFIYSEEGITIINSIDVFYEKISVFNRLGYKGDYLLFVRDIEDMLTSLGPTILLFEKSFGRLDYSVDRNGMLDATTAIAVLERWLFLQVERERRRLPSILSTLLDYARLIRSLGPERTFVVWYSDDLLRNNAFTSFVSDRYDVALAPDLNLGRENVSQSSWSQIVHPADKLNWVRDNYRDCVQRFCRDHVFPSSVYQHSSAVLRLVDGNSAMLGSDLV